MTEPTPEELNQTDNINIGINVLTDVVIELAGSFSDGSERDGPMNALLIAEGVLGRIIACFAQTYGGGEQEGLDDLLQISARHVRALAQINWDRVAEREAGDAAPDA